MTDEIKAAYEVLKDPRENDLILPSERYRLEGFVASFALFASPPPFDEKKRNAAKAFYNFDDITKMKIDLAELKRRCDDLAAAIRKGSATKTKRKTLLKLFLNLHAPVIDAIAKSLNINIDLIRKVLKDPPAQALEDKQALEYQAQALEDQAHLLEDLAQVFKELTNKIHLSEKRRLGYGDRPDYRADGAMMMAIFQYQALTCRNATEKNENFQRFVNLIFKTVGLKRPSFYLINKIVELLRRRQAKRATRRQRRWEARQPKRKTNLINNTNRV
jgi:hypothetical protein